jgi:hypothetical protein
MVAGMRREGDRVIVIAPSFRGMRGVVTDVSPILLVRLDGERLPLHFGEREVIDETSERHLGGAE